jgi:peptidoglycan hydrolase CwlO-like protein
MFVPDIRTCDVCLQSKTSPQFYTNIGICKSCHLKEKNKEKKRAETEEKKRDSGVESLKKTVVKHGKAIKTIDGNVDDMDNAVGKMRKTIKSMEKDAEKSQQKMKEMEKKLEVAMERLKELDDLKEIMRGFVGARKFMLRG